MIVGARQSATETRRDELGDRGELVDDRCGAGREAWLRCGERADLDDAQVELRGEIVELAEATGG